MDERYNGSAFRKGNGPVAQLGAHYIRIVGVGSSNLLGSTMKEATFVVLTNVAFFTSFDRYYYDARLIP